MISAFFSCTSLTFHSKSQFSSVVHSRCVSQNRLIFKPNLKWLNETKKATKTRTEAKRYNDYEQSHLKTHFSCAKKCFYFCSASQITQSNHNWWLLTQQYLKFSIKKGCQSRKLTVIKWQKHHFLVLVQLGAISFILRHDR